jgi:hypothetical protein
VDRSVLVRYARDLPRPLPLASDHEKRVLLRGFVSAAQLDPERRKVNLDLQLPANRVRNVEAAARITLIGAMLTEHARVRLHCAGGTGRRAAAVTVAADA